MAPKNIVIVGAGIIGSSTAYYLSRHPAFSSLETTITLLEASKIGAAQGASGKAGGLIAKWAYPKELVRVSFAEHEKLAKEYDGAKRWGFRYLGVGQWEGRGGEGSGEKRDGAQEDEERARKGMPKDLTWVDETLTDSYAPMAKANETGQVHPWMFTTSMVKLAEEKGVKFVQGRATSLEHSSGQVTGVRYLPVSRDDTPSTAATEEQTLEADYIILTAGAWSPTLFPKLPISCTRAHSIVVKPPSDMPEGAITPYALFTSITISSPSGRLRDVTPEIYPRPDPAIYICGPGDERVPLPPTVDDVEVDQQSCDDIWDWVANGGVIKRHVLGEVARRQACYLPTVSTGGGPIVGPVPGVKGLIVAAGHTCWGICNAPGTGKAISELVMEGEIKCANLAALDPKHYV